MHEAGGGGGGGEEYPWRIPTWTRDEKWKQTKKTSKQEGKKPDVQRLQQSQTLKCRKENETKAECRSVQCRSSDDGR